MAQKPRVHIKRAPSLRPSPSRISTFGIVIEPTGDFRSATEVEAMQALEPTEGAGALLSIAFRQGTCLTWRHAPLGQVNALARSAAGPLVDVSDQLKQINGLALLTNMRAEELVPLRVMQVRELERYLSTHLERLMGL